MLSRREVRQTFAGGFSLTLRLLQVGVEHAAAAGAAHSSPCRVSLRSYDAPEVKKQNQSLWQQRCANTAPSLCS